VWSDGDNRSLPGVAMALGMAVFLQFA
jgi:hypothetical protein